MLSTTAVVGVHKVKLCTNLKKKEKKVGTKYTEKKVFCDHY